MKYYFEFYLKKSYQHKYNDKITTIDYKYFTDDAIIIKFDKSHQWYSAPVCYRAVINNGEQISRVLINLSDYYRIAGEEIINKKFSKT